MRLSEIKGERALEVLADLIDPVGEICADEEIKTAFRTNKKTALKLMLKTHKSSVIAVMAALDGATPQDYDISLLSLPVKLMEILNDPEVVSLFTSAATVTGQEPSGAASVTPD